MFSAYVLSRKDTIFDPRNIRVAVLDGDDLGPAMGLRAFHRSQVIRLIRKQLVPIELGCCSVNPLLSVGGPPVQGGIPLDVRVRAPKQLSSLFPPLYGFMRRGYPSSLCDEGYER